MKNIIKGLLIGIANIIPGVSGGTFALILGIYDRLIEALGNISIKNILDLLNFKDLLKKLKSMDALFLIQIAIGAVLSIGMLSWVLDFLLKNHPAYTLSVFLGLIIPSIKVPYAKIREKNLASLLFVIPGVLLVVSVNGMQNPDIAITLPLVFLSGVIAISAMILPGISGSFILLVIGLYESIIFNIKTFLSTFSFDSFIFLAVFGLGCIAGLIFFVRIMKFLFSKYHDKTLYFLIGLVAGSVVVLWPFKDYPITADKIDIAITTSKNILPSGIKELLYNMLFVGLGVAGSFAMNFIEKE